MDFDLTAARGIPQGGEGLSRIRRTPKPGIAITRSRSTRKAMGALGQVRAAVSRGVRRGGATSRRLRRSRSSVGSTVLGHHARGGVGLGANWIFQFGTEVPAVAARLCVRCFGGFGLTGTRRCRRNPYESSARDGPEWVINGEKSFITNSGTPITPLVTVTAVTGSTGVPRHQHDHRDTAGTPGFVVQPPYRKMGWHAPDTHGLSFVDCRCRPTTCWGAAASPTLGDPR